MTPEEFKKVFKIDDKITCNGWDPESYVVITAIGIQSGFLGIGMHPTIKSEEKFYPYSCMPWEPYIPLKKKKTMALIRGNKALPWKLIELVDKLNFGNGCQWIEVEVEEEE